MRTTLDIADDVLVIAEDLALRENRPVGEIISALARRALLDAGHSISARKPRSAYDFRPFAAGDAIVTNGDIDDLRGRHGT